MLAQKQLQQTPRLEAVALIMDDLSTHPVHLIELSGDRTWHVTQWSDGFRSDTVEVRVESPLCSLYLVIKFLKRVESSETKTCAQAEYALLCEAEALFSGHAGLHVPRPVRSYPSLGAFVMQKCEGSTVTKFLSHSAWMLTTAKRRRCTDIVRKSAQWLAQYHAARKISTSRQELVERQLSSLSSRLDALERLGDQLVPRITVQRLRDKYVRGSDAATWASLSTGRVHHDFGCHNILVNGDGIAVLDLGDTCDGFVLEDISRFCVELEILDNARFVRWDKELFPTLVETFLEECEVNEVVHDTSFFAVQSALAFLLTIAQFKVQRRFLRRWHSRAAKYLKGWLAAMAAT